MKRRRESRVSMTSLIKLREILDIPYSHRRAWTSGFLLRFASQYFFPSECHYQNIKPTVPKALIPNPNQPLTMTCRFVNIIPVSQIKCLTPCTRWKQNGNPKIPLIANRVPGESNPNHSTILAVQIPADERRDEICAAEDVDWCGDENGAVAHQGAGIPCYLRLIDGKMRADRTVTAL